MHYTFFSSPFFLNILLPACQDQFNQGDVKRSDIYTNPGDLGGRSADGVHRGDGEGTQWGQWSSQ